MRWSIRYQLLVPVLILLLGVVVGISAWSGVAAVHHEQRQIETQVRSGAQLLCSGQFRLTKRVLEMTHNLTGADYIVVDEQGTYKTNLDKEIVDQPAFDEVTDDPRTLSLGAPVTVADQRYLSGGVQLRKGEDAGSVLYILYPESLWRDALWAALLPSLVLGTLGSLTSVVLAVGLAHRLGRGIQELERRTRLIAAGDFSPMPLPRRADELRDLSQSVNEMAAQLARLQDATQQAERLRLLGQVGGGLAHQLRNGVTGARLAVQLHVRECNGSADTEPLQVALRQLDLVEANLKRFLDLGRADNLQRQPCSLAALVGEAVRLLRPQCTHARTEVRWQPGEDITLSADPALLGHLLHNVLGNAVEAAGPGGCVEVNARRLDAGRAVLEIFDSGPGPAPELADRLFDPFVTGKREGIGLGLSVARRVAEAHGGSIAWSRDGGRTCFRIELPGAGIDEKLEARNQKLEI